MLVYLDLPVSNKGSLARAIRLLGISAAPARVPADLVNASAILLPGVGAFAHAMAWIEENGLADPLRERVCAGVPLLGICLGMQLLADFSEEGGGCAGLGLIPGRVVRLPENVPGFPVPNIGWCDARVKRASVLFPSQELETLYHVHSYHMEPASAAAVTAVMDFAGAEIAVAVEADNVFGVQFHPEKSQDAGLEIIAAFLRHYRLLPAAGAAVPCLAHA